MPQITITVHNKPYTLSCPSGNEAHVYRLAQRVNTYIDNLIQHGATLSNQGLLIFALLGMAEKIETLTDKVSTLEEKLNNPLAALENFSLDFDKDPEVVVDPSPAPTVAVAPAPEQAPVAVAVHAEQEKTFIIPAQRAPEVSLLRQRASLPYPSIPPLHAQQVQQAQPEPLTTQPLSIAEAFAQAAMLEQQSAQSLVGVDEPAERVESAVMVETVITQTVEIVCLDDSQANAMPSAVLDQESVAPHTSFETIIEQAQTFVSSDLSDQIAAEPLDTEAEQAAVAFLSAATGALEQWDVAVSDMALSDNLQQLKKRHEDIASFTTLSTQLEQNMLETAQEATLARQTANAQTTPPHAGLDLADDSSRLLTEVLERIAALAKKLETTD